MAMKELLNGECGGANPLMSLTEQIRSRTFNERSIDQYQVPQDRLHQHGERQFEDTIPQTFNMQSLLHEMQELQRPSGMAELNISNAASDWENEYMKQNMTTQQDSVKIAHTLSSSFQVQPVRNIPSNFINPPMMYGIPPVVSQQNWAHNYIDKNLESDTNLRTGIEIIESFEKKEDEIATDWVEQYKKSEVATEMEEEDLQVIPDTTENDAEYWEKLQQDWNELFSQEQFMNQEEVSFQSSGQKKDYSFEKNNPFAGMNNAFEEGLKKLEEGDLISAILLFEEAVTSNPDHAEAWQYLGSSQAENEQELLAIKALNRCLDLQPDNLEARMTLAVSYTNESMYSQACETLKSWIQNNPRYGHLIVNGTATSTQAKRNSYTSSLVSSVALKDIENIYLSAARISPQGIIDADIQIGLGVLFNISREYEKAIDCFNTGLQSTPNSALLWNKLGATLANSGKSGEATEAYRNALLLRPGFIRCRYNLGISCINMKIYESAVQHFLTALNMQRQGEDRTRAASTMSENIWDTLRMTISLLGRTDLLKIVESRDLQRLNLEFQES